MIVAMKTRPKFPINIHKYCVRYLTLKYLSY